MKENDEIIRDLKIQIHVGSLAELQNLKKNIRVDDDLNDSEKQILIHSINKRIDLILENANENL